MCRSAVLLEDKRVACYLFDGRNNLLRQQDIAVVLAINFYSAVDKHWVNSYDAWAKSTNFQVQQIPRVRQLHRVGEVGK